MKLTESQKQELKDQHPTGLAGILHVHNWKKIRKSQSFVASVLLTIGTLILVRYSRTTLYITLKNVADTGLSILPNILGFSLGGYALIIGTGNTSLIKSMTKKLTDENGSLFQLLSSIFAFSILLQVLSLILTYIVSTVIKVDVFIDISPSVNKYLYIVINGTALCLLSFCYFWSLLLIPFVVTNIFTFGQLFHFTLSKERMTEGDNSTENKIGRRTFFTRKLIKRRKDFVFKHRK